MPTAPATPPTPARGTLAALVLAVVTLLVCAAPAWAQADETVTALRRENDALRDRVAQLEAELASQQDESAAQLRALSAQVEALTATIVELRAALAAQADDASESPSEPADAPQITEPETAPPSDDPMASPGTLRRAVERDHADTFLNLDLEEGTVGQQAEARKRYLADLRRWTRRTERSFSSRISWQIRLLDVSVAETDAVRILFHVIDPASGLPFDAEPSAAIIEGRPAQRFAAHSDTESWELQGLLTAVPTINTERTEPGLIDSPPYLGTYTEFGFTIRATAAVPDLGVPQRRTD